jgi:uncharacterized protein
MGKKTPGFMCPKARAPKSLAAICPNEGRGGSLMAHATQDLAFGDSPIPARAGVGLKPAHYADIISEADETSQMETVSWFEAHPENYMCDGGPSLKYLEAVRTERPLSFHGVSLSLGSASRLNAEWLRWMRRLIDRFEPSLVSEHLSWSKVDGAYLNDLLPLPYTEESFEIVARHINMTQTALRRQILIENPSTYLQFRHSAIPEAEFLSALVQRTGCGLLVDVNNLYVNTINHGIDPYAWLNAIPAQAVGEFHLAGHTSKQIQNESLLIDDHGSPVSKSVWSLFDYALNIIGPRPTLIEWDTDIPPFEILAGEAKQANLLLSQFDVMGPTQ